MKKIDEIKALKKQLTHEMELRGNFSKKFHDQEKALKQLMASADAILANVAIKYGDISDDGSTCTILLPVVDIAILQDWDVTAERGEDQYKIVAKKKVIEVPEVAEE